MNMKVERTRDSSLNTGRKIEGFFALFDVLGYSKMIRSMKVIFSADSF
jgi:hypothetical protein